MAQDPNAKPEGEQLPAVLRVDCNNIVIRAFPNDDDKKLKGHTKIILVTPEDAWVKRLDISGGLVLGYKLKCGDKAGKHMTGLNKHNKYSSVDLGIVNNQIHVQFVKPKMFGIYCDYGTITLSQEIAQKGLTLMFFWPNDNQGDHYKHFLDHLKEAQKIGKSIKDVTGVIREISKDVVGVAEDAAKVAAMCG